MPNQIPNHIAIIMDGNGRWAQSRGHARFFGHVRGYKIARDISIHASQLGVKVLTLYAFSTENWNRPEIEKEIIWKILKRFLRQEVKILLKKNMRIVFIGEIERLDLELQNLIAENTKLSEKNTGMFLNIALSYGSRSEILRAFHEIQKTRKSQEPLTEEEFESKLLTTHLGKFSDVDLVIRTSGEKRISNFLLWQSAYSEFVFMEEPWPNFTSIHFNQAIDEFNLRNRRFGSL